MVDDSSNVTTSQAAAQAESLNASPEAGSPALRALIACTNGEKTWIKEVDGDHGIGRFVAEGSSWKLLCEIQDRCNAHDALVDAVTKAQGVLAKWIFPDAGIPNMVVLRDLLEILDDRNLVELLRGLGREAKEGGAK